MLLVIGVFAYNQVMLRRETASVDVAALETISQGLRTVQDGINKTTSSLGKIDEPKKALEIQEMVKAAIEEGGKVVSATQKIVEKPKESKNSPQVYSVISGVENAGQDLKYALEDMEQTYLEKQKEVARALIEELGAKNLSEEQTKLLEQAKNDYNNGLFGEALTKAIEISQGQK
jgi:predicted DNA binding protein